MSKVAAIIPLLFTSCMCQFGMDFGMKPDVTFGEHNERFDVRSIMQEQSRMVNLAEEDPDDYRRHRKRENQDYAKNRRDGEENNKEVAEEEKLLNALKDTVDFAVRSSIQSSPDDDDDYVSTLEGTRRHLQRLVDNLHGGRGRRNGRRGMPPDPENEILFHHGVPVNMKIEGFLEVPLQKK